MNPSNNSYSINLQVLPPLALVVAHASIDKQEYSEGELVNLNLFLNDDAHTPIPGAIVEYKLIKNGNEIKTYLADDIGGGFYSSKLNAPYNPGNYSLKIIASMLGYLTATHDISFVVKDTNKPLIPIIYFPLNNKNLNTSLIIFDWSESVDFGSGIAGYEIQVAKDISFSIKEINERINLSNYLVTLDPGTYYWRVRSIDKAGNQSDWSIISKFTIDIEAPLIQITSPTPNPTYSTDQPTINIKGSASDNIGVTQVTWANNRGGGGIASGTDSWEINGIPLFEGENIITVTARDAAGNINTDTLTVNYVSSSQPFPFSDDFSTDKGWTGYEMGGWERKPASAGGGENGNPDPAMDHSPTNDNYILGFAIGGDYPNGLGEEKSIISPPIDCTGQNRVFLKFWRYLNVENNSSDHARVYISSDGTNWTQLWENPVYDLKDNQWIQVVYDISAIAANQPTVYIKFTMGPTNSSGRFSGWNIDDLEVTSEFSGPMAIYLPYANIPNPNIDEILIQKGFGINHSDSAPSNLTDYSLLILQSYEASNQSAADRIRDFVQSGGGAIIMSGTPSRLASPTPGVGTIDLSYIKDWFGASWYGNDCGYATIVKDHPFGTDLVINDKVNYCPTDECWAAAVYGLTSNATAISQWSNKVRIDSFIHTFGQGRVFYYAGSPGYSEDPDPTLIDNGLTLFEAGLAWTAKKLVKNKIIDFDGDNKTDIAIYRKNFGAWYIKPSGGENPYGVGWGGLDSDKPVPGDYDGDGKTDIAIYRSINGGWYIIPSSNPTAPYGLGWGGDDSDKPVPGDYDGDRKTDIAVYRTNTGAWYIIPSSNPGAPYGIGWGGDNSDKPVPGDYDGDGKTDIAIYRSINGGWYIIPSSNSTAPYGVGWGGHSTDKPVPGDYDGDEKTDIAVYRAQFGTWFVIPSSGNNPYGLGWGGDDSDKPVPGDYDGDRKTDIAIYRGSIGAWYIYPSGGGIPYGVGWGGNLSDIPVTVNLAGLE
ncbi:MAG: FG-GAP-like repeat-containing protein [candidate division WOR-3 bacterium]